MDAVSGVAAAVQLADLSFRSLLKIYSVVRDASEVPKRLENTLRDLESFQSLLRDLQNETIRTDSKLALESDQSERLVTILNTIATCAETLNKSLIKILPNSSGSKVKRAWKALAVLPKEDGILQDCDRLQTLKQDLQLELQVIGIRLASFRNYPDPHRQFGEPHVVRLSDPDIESLARSLHQALLSDHSQAPDILRPISIASREQKNQAAARCCYQLIQYPSDLADAGESANALPQIYQEIHQSRSSQTFLEPATFCSCESKKTASAAKPWGLLETRFTYIAYHEPECKVFPRTKSSNEYLIRLSMRPFLQRTYELLLQTSCGAGGSSFSRTLKSYRVVNRNSSPAFQLFDAFSDLSPLKTSEILAGLIDHRNKNGSDSEYRRWYKSRKFFYSISPNHELRYSEKSLRPWFERLPTALEEMFTLGTSLPTDRDEYGNTLLHEVIFMWHYIGTNSPGVSRQIQRIAQYLYTRGADLEATSAPIFRASLVGSNEKKFVFAVSSDSLMSVVDHTYFSLLHSLQNNNSISNLDESVAIPYSLISGIGTRIDKCFIRRVERQGLQLVTKCGLLELITSTSCAAEGLMADVELSPLHHAILQRSITKVIQQMKKTNPIEDAVDESCAFNAVECAIGWDEGLVILAEAGYEISGALHMAIYRGDLHTLEILLSCDSDLGESPLDCALCLRCSSLDVVCPSDENALRRSLRPTNSHERVMRLIVNAIVRRREQLLDLTSRKLPPSLFQALDISKPMLDSSVRKEARALEDCGFDIPKFLRPLPLPLFHSFNICCPAGGLQLADMLYAKGFTEVDAVNNNGRTPLKKVVEKIHCSHGLDWNGEVAQAMLWLVDHGADVEDRSVWDDMPFIHHLAVVFHGTIPNKWNWLEDESFRGLGDGVSNHIIEQKTTLSAKRWRPSYLSTLPKTASSSLQTGGDIHTTNANLSMENQVFNTLGEANLKNSSEDGSENDPSSAASTYDSDLESSCGESWEEVEKSCHQKILQKVHEQTYYLTDNCDCYCSERGCTPIHRIPVLYAPPAFKNGEGSALRWKDIEGNIFSWIHLCDASESDARWYIEQACRLEIFERLGMAHTCCRRPVIDESEETGDDHWDELQTEDEEPRKQLELFMDEFGKLLELRASYDLWETWDQWWVIVDEIVPPLLPWERGMRYCVPVSPMPDELKGILFRLSEERSAKQLERAGYAGIDFDEVIHLHVNRSSQT